MFVGIAGLYLLLARSLAPNTYNIQGIGANAADMKPKVDTAHAPVKFSITAVNVINCGAIRTRRSYSLGTMKSGMSAAMTNLNEAAAVSADSVACGG